eukprot:gene21159-61226_t
MMLGQVTNHGNVSLGEDGIFSEDGMTNAVKLTAHYGCDWMDAVPKTSLTNDAGGVLDLSHV